MSHLEIEAGFLDHPKFIHAERLAPSHALKLWMGLMSYCKLHLTDGVVPLEALSRVHGPPSRWKRRALDALVDAKLVERTDTELRVHDFLEWNWSRAEIERRAADRKRRRSDSEPPASSDIATDAAATSLPTVQRHRSDIANDVSAADETTCERQPVLREVGNLTLLGRDPRHDVSNASRARSGSGSGSGSIAEPPVSPEGERTDGDVTTTSTGRKRGGKRGRTLCPADLKPDPTTRREAWELGFTEAKLAFVVREFINYWIGEGELKANWQATLRNRLANRAEHYGLKPRKAEDAEQQKLWQERRKQATTPPREPVKIPEGAIRSKIGGVVAN